MKVLITPCFRVTLHQIIVHLKYNTVLIQTTQLIIITAHKRLKVSQPKDTSLLLLWQGKESTHSPPSPPSFCVSRNYDCYWSCTPPLNGISVWFSEGKGRKKERLATFTALQNHHYYSFLLFSCQDYNSCSLLDPSITWRLLIFNLALHMKYREWHPKKSCGMPLFNVLDFSNRED